MTTNHPEKLDPALIRSGRCDLRIELKKMEIKYLLQLVCSKFGLEESQLDLTLINEYIRDYQYSPAQIDEFIKLSRKNINTFYDIIMNPPVHDF